MVPGIPTALEHLQQNAKYYLPGGDAYFLVERQIFRVHRYFLERESHFFQELFRMPASPEGSRNGQSESAAIILRDVTPAAFEKFLYVFYNPRFSVYGWSEEDWTTVIKLAQTWKFPQVLELAIRELQQIDIPLIKRIALYQQLDINESYLMPLYEKLCSRPQGLSYEDSDAIGLKTTVLIYNARERVRARGLDSPLPVGVRDRDVHAALRALTAV